MTGAKPFAHARGLSALVVDDEPNIRWALRYILEADGFAVSTASSGFEALENLLHAPQCDIVLVDAKLPDIDGIELAKRIRADTPCKAPMMLVSGFFLAEDEVVRQTLNAGLFAAFIAKPFSRDALLDRVREALQSSLRR